MQLTNKRTLVTGGAGYIGAHTVHLLLQRGYEVQVVDNLSRGHRHNVDPARLHVVDLADTEALCGVLARHPCEAVIHFAEYIAVGESTRVPELYFRNNVCGSLSLLTAMLRSGVKPDGSPFPDTMPWQNAAKMTDDDLAALYAYLTAAVP